MPGDHPFDKIPPKGYKYDENCVPWWHQQCANCGRWNHTGVLCDQIILAKRCIFCKSIGHEIIECRKRGQYNARAGIKSVNRNTQKPFECRYNGKELCKCAHPMAYRPSNDSQNTQEESDWEVEDKKNRASQSNKPSAVHPLSYYHVENPNKPIESETESDWDLDEKTGDKVPREDRDPKQVAGEEQDNVSDQREIVADTRTNENRFEMPNTVQPSSAVLSPDTFTPNPDVIMSTPPNLTSFSKLSVNDPMEKSNFGRQEFKTAPSSEMRCKEKLNSIMNSAMKLSEIASTSSSHQKSTPAPALIEDLSYESGQLKNKSDVSVTNKRMHSELSPVPQDDPTDHSPSKIIVLENQAVPRPTFLFPAVTRPSIQSLIKMPLVTPKEKATENGVENVENDNNVEEESDDESLYGDAIEIHSSSDDDSPDLEKDFREYTNASKPTSAGKSDETKSPRSSLREILYCLHMANSRRKRRAGEKPYG